MSHQTKQSAFAAASFVHVSLLSDLNMCITKQKSMLFHEKFHEKLPIQVIKSTRLPVNTFGYAFRGYQSIDKGIPASMAVAYRNTAYSASTGVSTRGNTGSSTNSQTELIHNRTNN
ncbi:hypothetical protein Y032_0045g1294 [Ancylostoma ceylanicum]|uniref:Uncharacterized protein n=1 Tax=Ancylostoma ceylanicum TaxID=53326 RepID=A0A016UE72_9BILA|nr:hypothetical protein Y032_0045g1294 [Ancylostoma ceylanicum]